VEPYNVSPPTQIPVIEISDDDVIEISYGDDIEICDDRSAMMML
jgi:hypothetical protein